MWKYNNKQIKSLSDFPEGVVGFVYMITDENGKHYIGKKSVMSITNPRVSKNVYDKARAINPKSVSKTRNKLATKKAGKAVWFYKRQSIKETNWLTYTGSSKPFNDVIKKGLKIKKTILHMCYNKKQMSYYETKEQICRGVIEDEENFWNLNILGKFYPSDLLI